MFHIKIEWFSPDYPSWTMYACQKFSVNVVPHGVELRLYLDGQETENLLGPQCVAYVMNEAGKTVEVIRPSLLIPPQPIVTWSGTGTGGGFTVSNGSTTANVR